jgi:hypothetical protein
MAVAADVPNRYDVVINGKGYMFTDVEEVKAQYGYTPPFVQRLNTQGDYGDNFQDFWLTATQRDWSLGEQQRHFRSNDEEKARRYWRGTSVDVSIPGQVSMRKATLSPSFAANLTTIADAEPASTGILVSTSTTVYSVRLASVTSYGAHGLGASPSTITSDSTSPAYVSSTAAGTVGVRKLTSGVWSTFSATPADSLLFHNNTLYGVRVANADLIRYDAAGAITSLFAWKNADGTPASLNGPGSLDPRVALRSFGPNVLILLSGGRPINSAWLWDGFGVKKLLDFPIHFTANGAVVVSGIAFFSGYLLSESGHCPAIYYWANGTPGLLWKADTTESVSAGLFMTPFQEGLAFLDDTRDVIYWFNPATGGVSTLMSFTDNGTEKAMASSYTAILLAQSGLSSATFYPDTVASTTATVTSSLFDFDTSLAKLFRGIKVEFDPAASGDGGSVDIAYRVGDVDGAYTTLQTAAVSGTEYLLSGITGNSISVKVTLNKGTSTNGPVLKRVSARASVKQSSFRKDMFLILCVGRDGESSVQLRDGDIEARDGLTMATELRAVLSTGTAVTITDEFGTFTGVIESDGFAIRRVRPNEFIAAVPVREI